MRKITLLFLSLAFMSIALLGCQSKDSTTIVADKTNHEQQSKENEKLQVDGEITKVRISKGNNATIFEDADSIKTLKSIISNAVQENGTVNMANPEFYMEVIFDIENKQSFHLWIGEKGEKGALMKTDDTNTLFTLSQEMTTKLLDFIK